MTMEKLMTEFAQVEQELAELTSQLHQSFKVLDDLAQVQRQFEELARTHQKFRDSIDKNNAALADLSHFQKQLQQASDDRLEQLETKFQSRWEELSRQVLQMQTAVTNGDRALRTDLSQQLSMLKIEAETRSTDSLEAVQRQSEVMRLTMAETETRLAAQLKTSVEQVSQTSASATYVDKLEVSLRNTRSSLRNTENQLRTMRNWLLVVTTGMIAALGLSLPPVLLGQRPAPSLPVLDRTPFPR
jgi:DNA repair exonuclease SbcCD ATPase subunit